MLRIVMYRNCILNKNYKEVFSLGKETGKNENVLEEYLNSLYYITLPDIENAYYENKGTLIFDETLITLLSTYNIYQFNYMKINVYNEENTFKFTRFCFINSISLKNGCAYVDYEEDIWHSYSDKISGIINSTQTATRVRNYSNFNPEVLILPVNYNGNNPLKIESLISHYTEYNGRFRVYAEIQTYNLVSASAFAPQQERDTDIYRIPKFVENENHELIMNDDAIIGIELVDFINKFVLSIQKGIVIDGRTVPQTTSPDGKHYEIGNIYILPFGFTNIDLMQGLSEDIEKVIVYPRAAGLNVEPIGLIRKLKDKRKLNFYDELTPTFVFEKTIANDYKNLSIGNFDKTIELVNNGTSHEIKIDYIKSKSEFGLFLNVDNKIIEISQSYLFPIPFNVLNSDAIFQRETATGIRALNAEKRITSDIFKIASSPFNMISTVGKSRNKLSLIGGLGQDFMGLFNNILQTEYDKASLQMLYNPMYSNSSGVFDTDIKILNSFYGICLFSIVPDNEEFVKKAINNYGYFTVNIISNFDDLDIKNVDYFKNNNINYNVLKFNDANVYGAFTNEIAEQLNEILNNSVKIWYNKNREEDNYVV